jgi:hypothetical protein
VLNQASQLLLLCQIGMIAMVALRLADLGGGGRIEDDFG